MPSFAAVTLPDDASKLRFKEPFVSQAMNLKMAGVLPPGVYRGYVPVPQAGYILNLNLSPQNDSVAVVETVDNFNLTVRSTTPITIDMSDGAGGQGQLILPVYVVIRTAYQLSPSPLTGLTTSQILVVQTSKDNNDPTKLHDGDIKLCKVLGFVATVPTISTVVPTDRQDNGGPLISPSGGALLARLRVGAGGLSSGSGAPVDLPGSTFQFGLSAPTIVAVDVGLFQDRVDETFHDSVVFATFNIFDLGSLVATDVWQNLVAHFDSGSGTFPTGIAGFGGIKRSTFQLNPGSYTWKLQGRVSGPGFFTVTYPLSVVVTSLGPP